MKKLFLTAVLWIAVAVNVLAQTNTNSTTNRAAVVQREMEDQTWNQPHTSIDVAHGLMDFNRNLGCVFVYCKGNAPEVSDAVYHDPAVEIQSFWILEPPENQFNRRELWIIARRGKVLELFQVPRFVPRGRNTLKFIPLVPSELAAAAGRIDRILKEAELGK